jgi:hypothetical protein
MSSNIDTSNINRNFPVQGVDNPSQGFRDNFNSIASMLDVAAAEITELQNSPVGVTTATTATAGLVQIGTGLNITTNGILSNPFILPNYTSSALSSLTNVVTGTMILVTNAPGGAQPCFYNGSSWYTINGLSLIS